MWRQRLVNYVGVLRCEARCGCSWHWSGGCLLSVNNDDPAGNQILDHIPQCKTAISRVPRGSIETAKEAYVVPMQKGTWRWMNLGKHQGRRHLGRDDTQRFYQRGIVARCMRRPSLPLASLPDQWSRIHWLGGGSDVWCVCPMCWSIYHLTRTRLSHYID